MSREALRHKYSIGDLVYTTYGHNNIRTIRDYTWYPDIDIVVPAYFLDDGYTYWFEDELELVFSV